jgi:hypothetical protein
VIPYLYLRTPSRREKLPFFNYNYNYNHNYNFLCLSLPSSLLFYPSLSLLQLFLINSIISFVVATARNKYKGDLVASFPLTSRCLKCFKYLLINPDSLCATVLSKKNCDRYNKGSNPCELVYSLPFSLKSEPKLT